MNDWAIFGIEDFEQEITEGPEKKNQARNEALMEAV